MTRPVAIVDDEPQALLGASVMLRASGIREVLTFEDGREFMAILPQGDFSVVVLDLSMPHLSGREILDKISDSRPHIPVIVMTAINEIETAVECMRAGAFDYLVKPVDGERFVSGVRRAMEFSALRDEVSSLKSRLLSGRLEHEGAFGAIITKSGKMRAIFRYIEAIADSHQPVLITGETGAGKELIAGAIHRVSGLKGEFVALNIAGLDDSMFCDTLFGHRRGAYTGAEQARDGLVARASGGTLFLDEIGDISGPSQAKLLRLLQEQTYYPLGSDVLRRSEARIVVATNRELSALMEAGKFRKDLYYRLRGHQIDIPPLRERAGDIPLLLEHFVEAAASSLSKKKPDVPPELASVLSAYRFPGNVRELQTMVYDCVARNESGALSIDCFRKITGCALPAPPPPDKEMLDITGRFPTLKEAQEHAIAEALRRSNGNQGAAASLLGISRQALNKRLNRKKS